MQEYVKKFSVNDVQMYREQGEDPDFAIVKLWALSEGTNTHKNPFSKEVLERDAHTFKGKFIVAKYDRFTKDVGGHEIDEVIIGYIPPNEEIEFKTKDVDGIEKEFVVVKGLLSKIYAKEIVDMFRENNSRTVSCEFSCATQYEENECGEPIDKNGMVIIAENPVLKYHIHGITVLGLRLSPSCAGTEIKVKQFAKNEKLTMKELAEQRKVQLKLVSHPIDKSKESVDMTDWNGDKAKDDLLKEKNFTTLAKSVCLLLEEGWKDRKKTALKYPVMNLKDGKWVYNAEGLSSARAYGEQHDKAIADKVISIQKRLELYKENKEDGMEEEKKLSESESKDTEKDVIMEEDKQMSESEIEKKMEDVCDEDCKEKEMSENEQVDGHEVDARIDDDKDEDEEKEEVNNEEKKFSLNAYVDEVAMLEMLKDETEANKELADELVKRMSANDIVEKFIKMAKENAELRAEKEVNDKEKRDKKFASIMASVKEDLDTKQFSELSEEGKELSLSELGAFENKVKAFAYEATKNKADKQDDGIMRFAGIDESQNNIDEDVFVRLSKK